jgi:tRNA uridine 5-carboxymethylaminomethyl modification enzyme
VQLSSTALNSAGIPASRDGGKRSAYDVLALADADLGKLSETVEVYREIDHDTLVQLQIDAVYSQYSGRQDREIAELRKQETQRIPADFDYGGISGLSNELKQKLIRIRPETILQASRIEGVTPAALLLLLAHLRKPASERLAG